VYILAGDVIVNSGWSDVARQTGVCLSAQFNSVAADGRQYGLWHQQVKLLFN